MVTFFREIALSMLSTSVAMIKYYDQLTEGRVNLNYGFHGIRVYHSGEAW